MPRSLFSGMERARRGLWGRLADFVRGRRPVDDRLWEALEESLIEADMGPELVLATLDELREELPRGAAADQLFAALGDKLVAMLGPAAPLAPPGGDGDPLVIAVVGVNGAGKTTTIGKLARRYTGSGIGVMLAASDTFRAAAVEQLEAWGQRAGARLVSHQPGADPAAVAFDAIAAAKARGYGVVIIDTAGRLHTKSNLMAELNKVIRVADRALSGAPHETLLVVDGVTGGNAFAQAEQFGEACRLTGVVLTKMDSTARGGTVFRITKELGLPVKLVGTGEEPDDLVDFVPEEFVAALLKPVAGGGDKVEHDL